MGQREVLTVHAFFRPVMLWSVNLLMVSPLIIRNQCLLIGVQYLSILLGIVKAN